MRAIGPKAYSYRGDSGVPSFDDRGPIVFMDGECALCTGAARVIARLDKRGEFRICPIQSDLGQAILQHYGLDYGNPDSWIYLADGNAFASLDAVIEAGTRLGGVRAAFTSLHGTAPAGPGLALPPDSTQPSSLSRVHRLLRSVAAMALVIHF